MLLRRAMPGGRRKNMSKRCFILFSLLLPLLADDRSKTVVHAEQTAQYKISGNGTIRLEHSYGDVDIEGWDKPDIEVTAIRSSEQYFAERDVARARRRLDSVKISLRQDGNDVVVSTVYPARNTLFHPLSRRSDVDIRYEIRAPRGSNLMISHNNGSVNVSGIRGAIHATVINGEITLTLAPGAYAIDAQASLGKIYSDFEGQDRIRRRLGEQFVHHASGGAAPELYLRTRIGDIVIFERNGPAD